MESFVQPSETTSDIVRAWLQEIGEPHSWNLSTSKSGDWLYLSLPVKTLESILGAEYFIFQNDNDRRSIIRTETWSLPSHLAEHIDLIDPTTSFTRPQAQIRSVSTSTPEWRYGAPPPVWEHLDRLPTYEELVQEDLLDRGEIAIPSEGDIAPMQDPTVAEACNRLAISPLCLSVLYGTRGYEVHAKAGVTDAPGSIAIVNFLGESANRSDAGLFLSRFRPDAAAAGAAHQFTVHTVAGGSDQQTPDTAEQLAQHKGYEGALDAQTILGLTWPLPLTMYNVGGRPPFRPVAEQQQHAEKNNNEPYLAWLRHMRTLETLPSVVSISYAEDEKTVPEDYARRVCAEFALLGARGVSVLVASGDYGVGREGHCFAGEARGGRGVPRFMPSFPASCPYVTAVGATRFLRPEMVAFDGRTDYASGGGFSDVFSQPAWQRDAVDGYLGRLAQGQNGSMNGLFNPKGRAYPDVAAQGYHFAVMWNGSLHLQDGTSASTPVMASIVALVNDALVAQGRPPMGFLNPWIYSKGRDAFTDVTWGSNRGCNTTGFPAKQGWDPATGFGTPVSDHDTFSHCSLIQLLIFG